MDRGRPRGYVRGMEIRVLRYFLEAARQGSISKAAQVLHVTQPTMSRQLKDLEWELGEKLFVRSNYSIRLTHAGELLRERAEDILGIVDKTMMDFRSLEDGGVSGEISIACAESKNISFLGRCIQRLKRDYPKIRYHLYSGDSERALEKLDKGLFDFAVLVENVDLEKYNCLTVHAVDRWGVVMRRDSPLADRDYIVPEDLLGVPILCSRQALAADMPKWFGDDISKLNIAATLDLSYNGSVLVREGTGCLLTFDGIIDTSPDAPLCFKPLMPELTTAMHVVWRRNQQFSQASRLFLQVLKEQLER